MLGRAMPVLPAEDMARAKAFYTGKLGLSVMFEEAIDPDAFPGRSVGTPRGALIASARPRPLAAIHERMEPGLALDQRAS